MGDQYGELLTSLAGENDLLSDRYDAIFLVSWPGQEIKFPEIAEVLESGRKCDPSLATEIAVLPLKRFAAGRLVVSPTGPMDADYDDVRSLGEAAARGIKRAVKAGIRAPLVLLQAHAKFENAELVTLLGVLEALYVPLQLWESDKSRRIKMDRLGIYTGCPTTNDKLIKLARSLESGRIVARDIGGTDPERMAPPKVEEYVRRIFADSSVTIKVIDDIEVIRKEFPLFEAVNRAASVVERHRGRIIFLEYNPPDPSKVTETLMFVGKGVTYDTGGADIKAGGIMAGMSRDKCGSAAVAGFLKVVHELKPDNVRVIGAMGVVRNSVGSNCYVADEMITSRAGMRIRIGNTDAEGRMIMGDVLCKMKEIAVTAVNPHLFTIATLTGHSILSVGHGYSIAMDNGPARTNGTSYLLRNAGHSIGDPFEISTIRREDLQFHSGQCEGEDMIQCSNKPSSRTDRGHQGPAAFLLMASGLNKHGSESAKPLKYSHIDIAPSAGDIPDLPTGAPVLALANTFLLKLF